MLLFCCFSFAFSAAFLLHFCCFSAAFLSPFCILFFYSSMLLCTRITPLIHILCLLAGVAARVVIGGELQKHTLFLKYLLQCSLEGISPNANSIEHLSGLGKVPDGFTLKTIVEPTPPVYARLDSRRYLKMQGSRAEGCNTSTKVSRSAHPASGPMTTPQCCSASSRWTPPRCQRRLWRQASEGCSECLAHD